MPKMTGSRYFAEAMRGYGVTHLFYVNSVVGQAMQEMQKVGVTRVVTHGEKAAAYMADGYARAAHRASVCLAQNVGAANLAAGLQDAYLAGSRGRVHPFVQFTNIGGTSYEEILGVAMPGRAVVGGVEITLFSSGPK